jgi:hypothetical protein
MSEEIKIPQAIHHSHQRHQMDLGETIYLWSDDPGAHQIVGEIYNFDDLPDLAEKDCEDVEMTAIAIADKVVRAYNTHDDLLLALKSIVPPTCPIVTHHKPDCDFCRALQAIAEAEGEPK